MVHVAQQSMQVELCVIVSKGVGPHFHVPPIGVRGMAAPAGVGLELEGVGL
jgi:hypothetical protein